jgi:hypothetical protein
MRSQRPQSARWGEERCAHEPPFFRCLGDSRLCNSTAWRKQSRN